MTEYWHFATIKDGQPIMRNGTLIEIGKRYEIEGDPVLCKRGYHGSLRAIHALEYAPGPWVSLRPLEGVIAGDDKVVGKAYTQQPGVDATPALREFARWCALQVIHLWDAPQVVIDYLTTGDESLRDAARVAAWDESMAAAWDAALDESRNAARDVARAAARNAAWDAAWDAARNAARDAARNESRDAAWDSAWDVAWDVARNAQNEKLEQLLLAALPEDSDE
jgi:hypothetical protein